MIQIDNVTKRFPGGHDALRGLSLSVDEGEMVFVTGHSGAGKSTLLKLIALIERPTSGDVIVDIAQREAGMCNGVEGDARSYLVTPQPPLALVVQHQAGFVVELV